MNNAKQLASIRARLNEFLIRERASIGLTEQEMKDFGFVQVAKAISDPVVQARYCALTIELLEENIRALQTQDEDKFTVDWAETLLVWCTCKEELKRM